MGVQSLYVFKRLERSEAVELLERLEPLLAPICCRQIKMLRRSDPGPGPCIQFSYFLIDKC